MNTLQFELFEPKVLTFPKKRKARRRTAPKRRTAVLLPFPACANRAFVCATAEHMLALSEGYDDLPPKAVEFWHATTTDLFAAMQTTGLTHAQATRLLVRFRDEVSQVMQASEDGQHEVG